MCLMNIRPNNILYQIFFVNCVFQMDVSFSLIYNHPFRLSPAKFFALDVRKLVRPLESGEKLSFGLFTSEVQIFQLLQKLLAAKLIRILF